PPSPNSTAGSAARGNPGRFQSLAPTVDRQSQSAVIPSRQRLPGFPARGELPPSSRRQREPADRSVIPRWKGPGPGGGQPPVRETPDTFFSSPGQIPAPRLAKLSFLRAPGANGLAGH